MVMLIILPEYWIPSGTVSPLQLGTAVGIIVGVELAVGETVAVGDSVGVGTSVSVGVMVGVEFH